VFGRGSQMNGDDEDEDIVSNLSNTETNGCSSAYCERGDSESNAAREYAAFEKDPHGLFTTSSVGETNEKITTISDKKNQVMSSTPPSSLYFFGIDDNDKKRSYGKKAHTSIIALSSIPSKNEHAVPYRSLTQTLSLDDSRYAPPHDRISPSEGEIDFECEER